MIIKEFYKTRQDGVNLHISRSDQNLKIRKVGTDEIYDEAVDVESAPYTYEETDIPIGQVDVSIPDGYVQPSGTLNNEALKAKGEMQ